MLFTMPPSFYTTPTIPTPATLPPIPFIEDELENFVTESADSLSTVTPKAKFYVNFLINFEHCKRILDVNIQMNKFW